MRGSDSQSRTGGRQSRHRRSRRVAAKGGRFRAVWVVFAVLLALYYAVPLLGLFVQSPGAVLAGLSRPSIQSAAATSLLSATVSTAIATALGVPLAYALARTRKPLSTALSALVALPLVVPPVVSGMLLVSVFQSGPVTAATSALSLSVTRSFAGVVAAQVFVASPFVVIAGRAAFETVDPRLEAAARTLGSSRWRTFTEVTLPLAWPGVLAGMTLTFARAIGEFGATLLVAYYPRTMPVQIWVTFLGSGLDAAFPVGALLLVVAAAALVVIQVVAGRPVEWQPTTLRFGRREQ